MGQRERDEKLIVTLHLPHSDLINHSHSHTSAIQCKQTKEQLAHSLTAILIINALIRVCWSPV